MAKKNNTINKPVYKDIYKDFDDEVIPDEFVTFILEGGELKRNKDYQFIENKGGSITAIKCPSTKEWCKGTMDCAFGCVGCAYYNTWLTTESPKKEAVNHPLHYGGDTPYECIKVLKAWLSPEEYKGFCRGNFIKYVCRLGKKDDSVQELKKARFYLDKLIESYEENKEIAESIQNRN